ncbi:phospholipase D-like domain-containing protein [Sphingomonas desiccabilis]|uniref:Phospholipase D n=1 Tax=Sphingomonas desiccabilis TaxID=429134 RepID=A0A4Q2IL42_9SPHN|nr:phospholipase D-like domain-containing protein [Sphingomonas desiccabilis]MBB3912644.1 phosphatidylserine/phosphatidylglycerophosphate/cardiolipin synthase-like enzyme [Sphingomonas desiccabilis]RXZ29927.1 phospholipase [Sphingomonas desiccabilis]
MARLSPPLEPGRNCWRIEKATRAAVIIDADAYFRLARAAMRRAEQQLLLIGWDFDGRIKLVTEEEDEAPARVGAFLEWLVEARKGLHVHILRWDTGAIKSLFRGSTILTILRWMAHPRITAKLDGFHPPAASHHQKIVVIDDCLAFCGGIDMTADRWDTRDHRADEPARIEPDGTPYGPWHDATTALAGPVAKALGELCRTRWQLAGGQRLPEPAENVSPPWPDGLDATFTEVEVAISRSSPEMPGQPPVREIEALYLDLIARAERWIYAESQYFASRKIAEAIARRLDEPEGPEIVIVNPVSAQGWLEPIAMDTARARLIGALRRRDRYGRFRFYHAENEAGEPIYIHAKVTVTDGEILRVGSSNFNNRSMRLDTECDVTIDSTRPANTHAAPAIANVAHALVAEHTATEPEVVARRMAETGSLIAAIESLSPATGRRLRPYQDPDLNSVEKWLADNEVLDPEGPDEMFEALSNRGGLLRRLRPGHEAPTPTALYAAGAVAAAAVGGVVGTMLWRRRERRD